MTTGAGTACGASSARAQALARAATATVANNVRSVFMAVSSFLCGSARHEPQRRRIHAIAQARRLGSVIEDMPQMRIAACAGNRGALHHEGVVADLDYVQLGDRRPETRPAGAGV